VCGPVNPGVDIGPDLHQNRDGGGDVRVVAGPVGGRVQHGAGLAARPGGADRGGGHLGMPGQQASQPGPVAMPDGLGAGAHSVNAASMRACSANQCRPSAGYRSCR